MPALTRPLVIGTRASRLARAQTDIVIGLLQRYHGEGLAIVVRAQETEGDQTQQANVPLQSLAGRGVFVKDLEAGLLDGSIDLAVHSLKDITTDLSPGLTIAAIPERDDPRDVLVSAGDLSLAALPAGARVGTSSPRRLAQLAAARLDLHFLPIRGNVDTRLRKVDAGEYDATVLAAAGLRRLGLAERIAQYFEPDACMPDPGQGALAIEVRVDDQAVIDLLGPLDHAPTHAAVAAERALLRVLGGGCQLPVGALGRVDRDNLALEATVASPDGRTVLRDHLEGPAADPEGVGLELARRLITNGAGRLLEAVRG